MVRNPGPGSPRVSLVKNNKNSAMKRLEVSLKPTCLYDLPIRPKDKRAAPDDSQAESGPKKKQKKEASEPKPLDVKAFMDNLKTDYSKKRLQSIPPTPPKQKWRPVKTAITDRVKAPKGWNPREPDLINE
jgi:hypothetical protein